MAIIIYLTILILIYKGLLCAEREKSLQHVNDLIWLSRLVEETEGKPRDRKQTR